MHWELNLSALIMTTSFTVEDVGRMSYEDTLLIQERYFNQLLEAKRNGTAAEVPNRLILVEHSPVYTLGKSGDIKNLKVEPASVGATFFKTNRGGDITYHGPGQIVAYPIFNLESFGIGLAQYIWNLEEAIVKVISQYGIEGERIKEASGVWLDPNAESVRKICAIGVKASRYVTMHGLAFNVNTDLGYFEHIIPCGIDDKDVTSLQKELGRKADYEKVKTQLVSAFEELFT